MLLCVMLRNLRPLPLDSSVTNKTFPVHCQYILRDTMASAFENHTFNVWKALGTGPSIEKYVSSAIDAW